MHRIFRVKAHEMKYGPHFNEEESRKAVNKMENEDGSMGAHWSLEESVTLANQYGVSLNSNFNRYDWYVALNMIYSDYYKVLFSITNSNNPKYFVEFAKAWLMDKDIEEGKMWYYYTYVMCDQIREAEMELYELETMKHNYSNYEDDYRNAGHHRMGGSRRGRMRGIKESYDTNYRNDYDDETTRANEKEYSPYSEYERGKTVRYVRY